MNELTFEKTTYFRGVEVERTKIQRGEAINTLSAHGVVLDRAVALIDMLPCGLFVGFRNEFDIINISRLA